jgi:hypothetical protein
MVQLSSLFTAVVALSVVSAAPLHVKRIAQVIAESTAAWEQACLAAGGAQQCNPISQTAFTSLLAAGGNCDQQNAADSMVDLAKQLGNDAEMIRLAQLFVQQPRNAPNKLQVPYCQTAPKNAELNGLFHCQFAGSDFTTFSGDQTGNVPLGLTAVSPPGSCPAKPDGPVPDGVQLNTLVQSPGSAGGAPPPANNGGASPPPAQTPPPANAPAQTPPPANAPAQTPPPAAGDKPFTRQNGLDAKALNDKFATLTADSPCTDGEAACINGGFAQCVGGKFAVTGCAGGLQCFALPLVNSPGTSITCDTAADAQARIANTGA